jgi:hypothetical protein
MIMKTKQRWVPLGALQELEHGAIKPEPANQQWSPRRRRVAPIHAEWFARAEAEAGARLERKVARRLAHEERQKEEKRKAELARQTAAEEALRQREDERVARMKMSHEDRQLLKETKCSKCGRRPARSWPDRLCKECGDEEAKAFRAWMEKSAAEGVAERRKYKDWWLNQPLAKRRQQNAAPVNSSETASEPPPVAADFMSWDNT